MKQVLQNLSSGVTALVEIPLPTCKPKHVQVQVASSLISLGTERMLVEFGRAGLLSKAKQQPEKVKLVVDKVLSDGLVSTYDSVKSKLDQPIPMGYCAAGTVMDSKSDQFKIGDRVVTNGSHAEIVCVPQNLAAKIPDNVSFEEACFVPLASIGLQGVRLAQPTLGETFVVMGLGLIGQLTVQLLLANGCKVIGLDFGEDKIRLAESFGATCINLSSVKSSITEVNAFAQGEGVDGVIVTASTKEKHLINDAAHMCRKRGRIILVGVTGLELDRSAFYEKELTFQVSCSYGPGRYDPDYEAKGIDYPVGFVRWTEQRNFEAVLALVSTGKLSVKRLITESYDFNNTVNAYKDVIGSASAMGVLLNYPDVKSDSINRASTVRLQGTRRDTAVTSANNASCLFLGAGNYASRILMPAFKNAGAALHTVVNQNGIAAAHHGGKNGFELASTDIDASMADPNTNVVVIATRHDSHAALVLKAIQNKKYVFVEKPLALTIPELDEITSALEQHAVSDNQIMVGFNRRFSPLIVKMKSELKKVKEPKCFQFTMNAGYIPKDLWVQSKELGGGRIVGEACHHIDLMRFLCGSEIVKFDIIGMGINTYYDVIDDKAIITLRFKDGSVGSIHYFANGGKVFPKERIEVYAADGVLQMDNFRRLKGFGWNGFKSIRNLSQDKGQKQCAKAFVDSVKRDEGSPISWTEILEVSKISILAAEKIREST